MAHIAHSQLEISGKVLKDDGQVLASATVVIANSFAGTVSDREGNFSFKRLKKGNYRLKISFIGYQTQFKDIYLEDNLFVIIYLKHSEILADEVVVTATRAGENTPVTHSNINFEEIETKNLGQDIPFLLYKVPSLVSTSDAGTGIGYSGLRIRGTSSSRINVTVNGIPLNDPESHDVYWVDLPDFISSVDNVQIQRGVGTSTNGAGAFGASINFKTSNFRRDPYAEINSSFGSFNTFKNTISVGTGLINNKLSFDLRLSKLNSDGFIDRAFADLKSFYFSGAYHSAKSIIKLNINSGKEKTYQAWGGVPSYMLDTARTYNPYSYENEIDDYQQDHYQLHYSREISKSLNFNAALFYVKGRGYYEQFKEGRKFIDYNLENVVIGGDTLNSTDLIQRKWLDNDFIGVTYSINYNSDRLKINMGGSWNSYDGDHFGRIIWAKYSSNGNIRHEWYNNTGLKKDFNIFTKLSYSLAPGFWFYSDLQFRNINYSIIGNDDDKRDISQEHLYNFFNPKFGFFYNISPNKEAYFSFAIANREPNRTNLVDAETEKLPGTETLYDYELGYKQRSDKFYFAANVYYMDYKDQLVLTGEINDVGSAIMVNVPESYRTGIEVITAFNPVKDLRWDLNLAVSTNKIINFTEYVDDWDTWTQRSKELGQTDLSFSPGLVSSSEISWIVFKDFTMSLSSKYVGKQFIDNTSSESRMLDPYLVNDLNFSYKIQMKQIKELGFYLKINNIMDEKYETNAWVYRYISGGKHYEMDGYFPQAGIHFLAGISLKF